MTDARHRDELSPSYSWYIRDWRASHRVSKLSWKERGFYRECLDWSWDLDGLPNDLEFIRGRLNATKGDFDKLWPAARGFYELAADGRLRSARQEHEREKLHKYLRRASDGGKATASSARLKRAQQAPASSTQQEAAPVSSALPLPSLSPLPLHSPSHLQKSSDSRSKRPFFSGQRLTVFEWMFDDLRRMLGVHTDEFGLDEWFYTADAKALQLPDVRKREDWWPWLLQETLAEAERRGLPIGPSPSAPSNSGDDAMWAAIAKKGAPPK